MIKIRIGGVPEHFNWPWQRFLESGAAAALGVDVEWRDYPDGSGAMAKALRRAELDAALLLTEGAVAGIADGGFRISSRFTDSPLIWGVHVPAVSRLHSVADLRGARYAISRRGSGSHLMAFVHARAQGWRVDTLEFVVVGNLDGAVAAFATGEADVFFWEKFMTKPWVDSGRFRRVAEFSAPWPAFVLCVADHLPRAERTDLTRVLALVLREAAALQARPDGAAVIAARYGLDERDAAEWLGATRWSEHVGITTSEIATPCATLNELGVLARPIDLARCLA